MTNLLCPHFLLIHGWELPCQVLHFDLQIMPRVLDHPWEPSRAKCWPLEIFAILFYFWVFCGQKGSFFCLSFPYVLASSTHLVFKILIPGDPVFLGLALACCLCPGFYSFGFCVAVAAESVRSWVFSYPFPFSTLTSISGFALF